MLTNPEIEKLVIAKALENDQAKNYLVTTCTQEHFTDQMVKSVFLAIQNCHNQKLKGTFPEILDQLRNIDPLITFDSLLDLISKASIVTTADIESNIQILTDTMRARTLEVFLSEMLIQMRLDGQPYMVAAEISEKVKKILPVKTNNEAVENRLFTTLTDIKDAMEGKRTNALSSGLYSLDEVLGGGFEAGTLTIIAGRPGMGKTAIALTILSKHENKAGLVSMEMLPNQMARRELSMLTDIPYKRLKKGSINQEDYKKLGNAAFDSKGKLIKLESCGMVDLSKLRSIIYRMVEQEGCKIVAIDYLQRMQISIGRGKNEASEIGDIVNAIKAMAIQLGVPIILLSQLGREVEKRTDKKPNMSDLRGSGMIEEAADNILLLFRAEYYDRDNPDVKGRCDVIVEKNRDGDSGIVIPVGCKIGINQFYDLGSEKYPSQETIPSKPIMPNETCQF
ncbi:MAG: AAA family ATPase [Bacteroidia bacterium]|nr:AAA family ATPase [Bacteroidia bacterium]